MPIGNSTQIQAFHFNGSQVSTMMINDEPYFVGSEVASILGYSNTAKAIRDHVDTDDKLTERIVLSGQHREAILINESGLYSLILSSKLPSAKEFKHWVTSEVLPSIRRHGGYLAGQEQMSPEQMVAASMQYLQSKISEQQKQLEAQAPKVLFADSYSASNKNILVGEFAKILKQNGVDIGQTRLFEWLRSHGYLMNRKGRDWNCPTQKSMNLGLFKRKATDITHADGHVTVSFTTLISPKGQRYFINKFLGNGGFDE